MSAVALHIESDTFQNDSTAFLEWLCRNESTRISPKVELVDLRAVNAGRGVLTSSDIAADEELFAIPRSLVLDVTNSDLQTRVQDSLEQFGPWLSLIVVLIYEYLRKEESGWYPYFRVLPRTFNTLMFWSSEELAELQGSAVIYKIGRKDGEEAWKLTIIPFMLRNSTLFPVADEAQLFELAHMAGSLIMAYAFDLGRNEDEEEEGDEDGFVEDDEDDPAKGMIPFADMLNANADRNNARLFHVEDFLVMKATKSIKAGEEVYNDYGPLPRSELLRMYGYVTANYAQYDVVEVTSELLHAMANASSPKDRNTQDAVIALEELTLLEDGYAIQRPSRKMKLHDAIPTELHMLISALSCPNEAAADFRTSKYSDMRGFSIPEAAFLTAIMTKRLTDYKTTVDEDEAILSSLNEKSSADMLPGLSDHHYRMAVQVRKGEKEILHRLVQLAQECITSKTDEIANAPVKRKRDGEDHNTSVVLRKARKE